MDEINRILDEAPTKYNNLTAGLWLEMVRTDITEFSMWYGKSKASQDKKLLAELRAKINTQEKKLACINLDAGNAFQMIEKINVKLDALKSAVENIESKKTRGAMLRSKANYYLHTEMNSKYFFNLEKRNSKGKAMTKIKVNEEIITNPKRILEEQQKFYQSLYTTDKEVIFNIDFEPENKISDEQRSQIEEPLRIEELSEALKSMKPNKTPGPCGITADFYKVNWLRMKSLLLEVFNECFEVRRMYPSGRRGIISLIPKSGKDILELKNWRPIILLCVEYKILAKAIANRIKSTLTSIISSSQSGFMAGRNITQNIRKIIDTIDLAKQRKMDGLLLTIDFMKAFDRVEYNSLYEILKWFNFGPNIIRWVKILFTDFNLCTVNNGFLSNYLKPTRGLFQGNPISSYGFLATIELLAIMLKKNTQLEGLQIDGIKHLLSMFADDVNIFTKNKEKEWLDVRRTLEQFSKLTGLKISYDKTSVYRLGNQKTNAKYYSMKKLHWSEKEVNVLGIIITKNRDAILQRNIEPILEKVRNILNSWKCRDLSLI